MRRAAGRSQSPSATSIHRSGAGWSESHLHQFSAGGLVIGAPEFDENRFNRHRTFEATEISLHDLVFLGQEPGVILYEYDFGDSWIHAIEFDTPVILERGGAYPVLLGGSRARPPEDVGGPEGYERFLSSTLYVHAAKQRACAIRSMRVGDILCGSRSGGER